MSRPCFWPYVIWFVRSLDRALPFAITSSTVLSFFLILSRWDSASFCIFFNGGVFPAAFRVFLLTEDLNTVLIDLLYLITHLFYAFYSLWFCFTCRVGKTLFSHILVNIMVKIDTNVLANFFHLLKVCWPINCWFGLFYSFPE